MANPPQPVCNIAAPSMRAIEATHRLSPTQLAGYAASTALASTVVSLLRSVAAPKARGPAVGLLFIALSSGFGAWLYTGCVLLLPIAASCIGTAALFLLQGLRMRMLMPFGTLLWLVHNLLVGSLGGRVLEACLLVANLWTIRGL